MKNKFLILVICSFFLASTAYFTATLPEAFAPATCFIFGDISGGY